MKAKGKQKLMVLTTRAEFNGRILPIGSLVVEDNAELFTYGYAQPVPLEAKVMPFEDFRPSEIWMKDAERMYHVAARFGYGDERNSFHKALVSLPETDGFHTVQLVLNRWLNNRWVGQHGDYLFVTNEGAEFCFGMFNDYVGSFPNVLLYPLPTETSLSFGSTFYDTGKAFGTDDGRLSYHETDATLTYKYDDIKLLTVHKVESEDGVNATFKVQKTQFTGLRHIVHLTRCIAAAVEAAMAKWEVEP